MNYPVFSGERVFVYVNTCTVCVCGEVTSTWRSGSVFNMQQFSACSSTYPLVTATSPVFAGTRIFFTFDETKNEAR